MRNYPDSRIPPAPPRPVAQNKMMNERIEKLLEQCQIETYGVNGELLEFGFDAEKFAELIVRECAQVCLAQRDPANLNYKPSEKFAEAVKQHFGVEE